MTDMLTISGGQVRTESATESRLSQETHDLAAKYQAGIVGRSMKRCAFGDPKSLDGLPPATQNAKAVEMLANHAPLRIDADELLVGSATLLEATWHQVPFLNTPSTSHVTVSLEKLLRLGYAGLREQVSERLSRGDLRPDQVTYLQAIGTSIDAAGVWHRRHVDALRELHDAANSQQQRNKLTSLLATMAKVPENPPTNFREAIQTLWEAWTFQRLCGNWPSIGRIDWFLGPYLKKDLAAGTITLDEARELLAHFWIKGSEWIGAEGAFGTGYSGDAQFYQNVILAGIDENGDEVVNEVTYLVLDVIEELHISDFPIAVRVSARTPEALWRKIAQCQRHGGGIVSIYNEDLVIRALTRFGYPLEEARSFTNDGCWEVIIPGKTSFSYVPFDTLAILQDLLQIDEDAEIPAYESFEDLYTAYREALSVALDKFADECNRWCPANAQISPLLSLFVDNCVENGADYHDYGPNYTVRSPHAGGLPDVANSLHVINQMVYVDRKASLAEIVTGMRANWNGHESLQNRCANDYLLYGNADPLADAMARRLFDDYVTLVSQLPKTGDLLFPPGISTFGREQEWRNNRLATATGKPAHSILAPNLSASAGTERRGVTGVVRSFCSMNFEALPNGVPLDLMLSPSSLAGDNGLNALVGLLKTFIQLGGWYLQINVVDRATLLEAQKHPDQFPNLTVRISGWSARFATLCPEWQEMIIERTSLALS